MQVASAEIAIMSLYLAQLPMLTLQQAGVVNAVAGGGVEHGQRVASYDT